MSAEKTFTLTLDQVDKINEHLGDVGAMIGCLCAAGGRASEFDVNTYGELLEEKFSDLVGEFNEATGQTIEAQKRKR
jgi:NTP pyrophosphatase (non-canonical NTP hydrolase)